MDLIFFRTDGGDLAERQILQLRFDSVSSNVRAKKIGTGSIDLVGIRCPRVLSKIRRIFLRLKATRERGQDEEERRSPPAVLPAAERDGGGDSDGIKERWSGLHFCSGDTSEPTSLPAGSSRATSSGCRGKEQRKGAHMHRHRHCHLRRRVG